MRALVDDLFDVGQEAHVQHPVRLVQHHPSDVLQADVALLQVVEQTPGRGDQHIDTALEKGVLFAVTGSTEDQSDSHLEKTREITERGLDLRGQLAGRRENQDLRVASPRFQL